MPIPEVVQQSASSSAITTKSKRDQRWRSGQGEVEHVSLGSRNVERGRAD